MASRENIGTRLTQTALTARATPSVCDGADDFLIGASGPYKKKSFAAIITILHTADRVQASSLNLLC